MIIMLAGKTKAGKTTFADIVTGLTTNVQRVAFGDVLKDLYSTHTGVPIDQLHDVIRKERFRPDMVRFADEIRAKDRFYFANYLFDMLEGLPNHFIIDDLRVIEELQVGKQRGAIPYRIHADNNTRKARGWYYRPEIDDHFTETEMDLTAETYRALGGDYIFNTTNDIKQLEQKAHDFLKDLDL